jgi:hypothetical protein
MINQIGDNKKAITDPNAVTHVMIAGSIIQRVHTTATNPAMAPAIKIIFERSSGFFAARSVNFCMIGWMVWRSLLNAGASAAPIVSLRLSNQTFIASICPLTVLEYASACHDTFCMTIAYASCAVVPSCTSIQSSFKTLVCPACTLINTLLAVSRSMLLYLARSIARLLSFCACA